MISKKLYENLPYYLRMLDEQGSGLLKHLTDPVQHQFDKWEDSKGMLELINNPDTIPKDWAYWSQQKVGGAGTREYWLGVGLHPDWPVDRMRRFLKEGWNYWNTKGTQSAIRWAIDLWLDWEKAQNPIYLEFRRPFGDRPTDHPTQWYAWGTPYDAFTTQHYTERQFFGGGDYPQQYQPDYVTLKQDVWRWEYGTTWDDRQLVLDKPAEIDNSRSGLGPRNVWMHFHLDETEWNNVAPDIHQLNPETWHTLARPQVFLWQDIETTLKLAEDPEFPISKTTILYDIDGFKYGDIYPWPAEQPARTETYLVPQAWQPDPYFEYLDFWGSAGGKLTPHKDRYTRTEVQRFASDWTAYSFFTEIIKTVAIETPGDRIAIIGADYLTPYGFETNTESVIETNTQLIFSPAVTLFADYEDTFGSSGGIPIARSPEVQIQTQLALAGGNYGDIFYSQGSAITSTTTTISHSYVGADYLSGYIEIWQYNVTSALTEESNSSFEIPAELWARPYSVQSTIQEFPISYTPALAGNQWFAGDRYVEIETITVTPANATGGISESWQTTSSRSPTSQQTQVTEVVEVIGFNGAQYSDTYTWQSPAKTTQTSTAEIRHLLGTDYLSRYDQTEVWSYAIVDVTSSEVEILASSGAGVPWTIQLGAWTEVIEELILGVPEFSKPSTTHLWYANYREWEEEVEIEIPGVQNCWSGLLADIETTEQETIIPALPAFPPNLWGKVTPDSQTVTVIPGIAGSAGVDYLTPFLSSRILPLTPIAHNLAPISLDGIAPLAIGLAPQPVIPFNPRVVFDSFAGDTGAFDSEDWWQYPTKLSSETIELQAGGFQLALPQLCFQYSDIYGQNFQWYTSGEIYQPTVTIEPVIAQYHLCNVVDNYTLQKLENRREAIETIPVSERAIEKIYPLLKSAAKQQEWTLSVETDEDLLLVQPLVLFTNKNGERSLEIALDRQFDLEFVFIIGRSTHIRSISLFVGQEIVENRTYAVPLNVHPKDKIGFKFLLNLVPAIVNYVDGSSNQIISFGEFTHKTISGVTGK